VVRVVAHYNQFVQSVTMVIEQSYLMNEMSKLDSSINYALWKPKIRHFLEICFVGNHDNYSSNINNNKHSCDVNINNNHIGSPIEQVAAQAKANTLREHKDHVFIILFSSIKEEVLEYIHD
jgi:hypothetical protein